MGREKRIGDVEEEGLSFSLLCTMPKQEKGGGGDAWDTEKRKANRTGTQQYPKRKRRRGQDSRILVQAMLAQARIAHSLRARVLLYCVGMTPLRTRLVELVVQVGARSEGRLKPRSVVSAQHA